MRLHLILLILISTIANARPCDNTIAIGNTCNAFITSLRPTQFNVGQREVDERAENFAQMSAKKLAKYIAANPLPVVLGPMGGLYVTDHHHLALALEQIGVDQLSATVIADNSRLNLNDFWTKMIADGLVFLEDKGVGGQLPTNLPVRIVDMTDDPYRSLAWSVRKQNGYATTDVRYGDFAWADFFRTRVSLNGDYDRAVAQAVELAHSSAAKNLPGYTP